MKRGTWKNPVRPDGGKKRKKKMKAKRKPLYVPVSSEAKKEQAKWLRGR